MARLELVELLDRHHVDRAEPIDLGAQPGDRFFGAERLLLGRSSSARLGRLGCRRRRGISAFAVLVGLVGADDSRVRRQFAGALELVDFRQDVVERRLDRVEAGGREMREIAFGGGARDVELGDERPGSIRASPRAVLIDDSSCSSARDAKSRTRRRRRSAPRTAAHRAPVTSASSCASPAAIAARSSATRRRVVSSSAARRGRARVELRRGFLETLHFRARPAARSTSAACAAPASAARRLRSSVASRASNRRRCARSAVRRRCCCSPCRRTIEARASS